MAQSTSRCLARFALAALLPVLAACGAGQPDATRLPAAGAVEEYAVSAQQAPRERAWDGVVEAVNQATLSAQTRGRVLELPFDVDDYVPAGAVVVRFTDVEQQAARRQAQAQLASAQASATEAESEYRRIADIHQRGLVARAQLDQALARRDASQAALESAQAALRGATELLDYTVIRAPYSGIVTRRHVQVGESVQPGQALISGLSLGALRIQVEVPQSEIAAIREQSRAALLLDDGRRIEASKVTVFPYADPQTHAFKVRIDLPEEETGLHPGMSARVAFLLGSREQILLPLDSLLRRGELVGVYVLDDNGLQLRQIRVGHRQGERIEVLSGLRPGERIARDPRAAAAALSEARAEHARD